MKTPKDLLNLLEQLDGFNTTSESVKPVVTTIDVNTRSSIRSTNSDRYRKQTTVL